MENSTTRRRLVLDNGDSWSVLRGSELRERDLLTELSYACRFWTDHLHRAGFAASLADSVRAFFGHERLLFWLEVLSLLKMINISAPALSRVIEWVTVRALLVSQRGLDLI